MNDVRDKECRYRSAHFHSVTHEAYAVIAGSSTLRLGAGPLDDENHGVWTTLRKGDVIILPAGVAHASVDGDAAGGSEGEDAEDAEVYEYLGFYPRGSPQYDNNFCKASPEETEAKAEVARAVPVPEWDVVDGEAGSLVGIWGQAARR